MKVTQVTIGRFHHFHLARQMERFGLLETIYTAYPFFKLKDESGILRNKIKTFPFVHVPFMKRGKLGLDKLDSISKEWEWFDRQILDWFVASKIKQPGILVALSGCGLKSGKKMQMLGGKFICDRGSSHIEFQNEILIQEYKTWGFNFNGIDKRVIAKELEEYYLADKITVPSEFVKQSFILKGIDANRVQKIPYGARLDRFKKVSNPESTNFRILWVGAVSIRKGFMYALKAFQQLKHPRKEFIVIGSVESVMKQLLSKENLNYINFIENVSNAELPTIYSSAHVFVLSSIEEGLAMVQGEALACGCPVIATKNTGGEDLFTNGKEGFIVPIKSSQAIAEKLQQLADEPYLRNKMSVAAIAKVNNIGGWDNYGNEFIKLLNELKFIY